MALCKNLLMSRRPGPDFSSSNGHARSALLSDTRPLSSNLLFQVNGGLNAADLKKKFLDACRDDGHEWCLEVKRMDNPALGSIRQEDFSDFIGGIAGGVASGERMPLVIYRVYVSDGHEEMVRGGHIEGLQLRALRNIVGMGDDETVVSLHAESFERICRHCAGRVRIGAGWDSQHGRGAVAGAWTKSKCADSMASLGACRWSQRRR